MYLKVKTITAICSILVITVISTLIAFSASHTGPTDSWSYSNYNNGSYVPRTGTLQSWFFDDSGDEFILTKVSFTLDSYNVSQILDYNDGGTNPHPDTNGKECFLTLDVSSDGDSWDDEIDAYSITSSLPNPKYDLEDDNFDGENEESEVVVLGTVSASSYNCYTYWNDYRDGDPGDSGKIQAQFAMSTKGFFDYNNIIQSSAIQATITYGDDLGNP